METNFEVIKKTLDSLMETESEIMNSKNNQQLYDDIFEKTKILISGGLTKDELFTSLKKSTYLCVLHQSMDSDAFKSTIDLIISRVEIGEDIDKEQLGYIIKERLVYIANREQSIVSYRAILDAWDKKDINGK